MKVISLDKAYVIVIPKNIYSSEKLEMVKKVKDIILKYNTVFSFLENGYYEVEVGYHDLVGTVLRIVKKEDLSLMDLEVELKVKLIDKISIAFRLDSDLVFSSIYLYQDNYYVLDDEVIEDNFYTLIEHGEYIFSKEIDIIKRYGQQLKKPQSGFIEQ